MPYVNVPNDLSKIKTKIALNLTKRQLLCFGGAAIVGLPTYFFTRSIIGNSAAMLLMIAIMLPMFFFAMYEKDGLPFEKVARNIIYAKFINPRVRPYKFNNFYNILMEEDKNAETEKEVAAVTATKRKKKA